MRTIKIEVGGEEKKVVAQKVNGSLWFHVDGRTIEYVPPSKGRRKGGSAGKGVPGKTVAPMPGKIMKVHVKPGDNVKVDDLLVTMEAMKMEYNLKADIDGVVAAVGCNEGDQVTMSQLLVELIVE